MEEEKIRIWNRISSSTELNMREAMCLTNCRSQNEFVEEAIQFYSSYVKSKNDFAILPPVLVSALRATIQSSEDRIARLLFKLAVELSMTMNVVAAGKRVSDEDLKRLRSRCIREVKQNNGQVTLLDAMHYQHDEDEETVCQD